MKYIKTYEQNNLQDSDRFLDAAKKQVSIIYEIHNMNKILI
jgi:hypothetical protein